MSKSSVFQSVSVTESDLPNLLSQVQTSETNAANSAAAAATSAASVGTSASNAATEASNASNSATAAANSASAASTSASAAATSETNAAAHVTTASNHATGAATSATSATNSQAAATQSATDAATSATNAATSETNAATSETNAATSATNAANSATAASTQATNATNQATAAANSATAAASSASAASTSETNAQTHANTASGHATTASTQATNAATSATNAATSETNAGTQATNAATSATAAASSATNAATAQTAAESARDSALAAFDSFDDRYLGTKTSDPSTDNDGNTLVAGTLYFNSSTSTMMLYTGSAWVAAYVSGGSFAALSGATFTGDVTVPNLITAGNVDGRDVSVDGAKLDGIAANATAVTSLTDLSISDGTNGQVLTTNGSGSFSFADAAGGGSTQDADGDTKIQVEEGTDDDTIRFDTAGSERLIITPTGNVGINTTTPYDSQWGTDGNNTELAIEGGSTGYGVLHLRGTGAGTTDTRFSMGVGDTKFYMAYDRIDGAHRMTMNTDGAIGFNTTDVGTETLTVNKVGSSSYGAIQIRRSNTDGDTNGGYISFAQRDDCSTSWVGLAGWDNATDRTVYLGGGGWNIQEATAVVLYAGAYDAGSGGATESARFAATFNMLKRPTTVQSSGVPLKVDSTNSNNFKQRWENNGSVVGYLGANASYALLVGGTSANTAFQVSQSGGEVMQTRAGTNAHYRFHLDGAARNYIYANSANEIGFLTTGGNWAFRCDNSGNVTATGNVTAYSDIRLKEDIKPIEGALERVSKLEGVEYTRKNTGKREIGFIAQDVIQHEPTLVDVMDTSTAHTDEAFSDLHVMKYQNTVALLVEAVKELKAEVAELRAGCCHGAAK